MTEKNNVVYRDFQMDTKFGKPSSLTPEQELMQAVLYQAILDVRRDDCIGRQAEHYISTKEDEHMFSFISICKSFGLDPSAARSAILSGKKIAFERRRAKYKSEHIEISNAA